MTTTKPDVLSQADRTDLAEPTAKAEAATGPTVGAVLARRYRLDEQIGTGGMATVFRATDESLGRVVAIKRFRQDVADAADVRRQESEVRLVASLSHPGVVTLFDAVADDDGSVFLVLQHVAGTDLRDALGEGPLPRAAVQSIGVDIAEALAYVHARGVIHRDLKPANILVQHVDGRTTAMLTDFGIAQLVDGSRFTATGSVLGTAAFLSPEQALGKPLTPATDIYSLGLVLLECLSGKRVFPGSGIESAAARLSQDPRVPTDLGSAWTSLLSAMTARDPGERPTAAEVAACLRAISPDDELDPTRRLPALGEDGGVATEAMPEPGMDAATAPTVRDGGLTPHAVAAAPDTASTTTSPVGATRRLPRRSLVGAVVAVAVVAAAGLGWWAVAGLTTTTPESSVEYPVVEGELGVSLELLERSVAP